MPLIRQLKDTEPFSHLPDNVFQEIASKARQKTYAPGVSIFNQNDPPTGFLYVIKSGLVEITVQTPGGTDMVVDYRKEGSFFGGTPIFTGETYTGGARTLKVTECYLIPEEILKRAGESFPQLGEYFTRIVLSRLRQLYSEIVSEHTRKALTEVESYPFKKRLSEIMNTSVETCSPSETAREVAGRLINRNVSSVLVLNGKNRHFGIITERDLVSKVILPENSDPSTITAADVMNTHPYSMTPDTYMYEAMAFMNGHGIRHLPVVEGGELVGMVTLRDLMRYRSHKAMLMIGNVKEEATLEGLTAIRKELLRVARSLLSETRSTAEVMEVLSHVHHAIIKRVYEICLDEMKAQGKNPPDIRFCFLLMGSGGRREMLLNPDQDNGFIFENVSDAKMEEIEPFFAAFGEKLVDALARVGYERCSGKVMANNPQWRGRLDDWQARISDWVNNPEPQKVRYSSIFFDFIPLVGDPVLAYDLRRIVHREIREFQGFLYHMMALDLRYKVPLGLLGRFIVEKSGPNRGKLSLKHGGSVYIVDCIRMFALERELQVLTTQDRLNALVDRNVFEPETAEHIRAAFDALNFLRLRNEISRLDEGKEPSHYLDPSLLSKTEQDLLKEAFGAVSKLQDATKRHFAKTPF